MKQLLLVLLAGVLIGGWGTYQFLHPRAELERVELVLEGVRQGREADAALAAERERILGDEVRELANQAQALEGTLRQLSRFTTLQAQRETELRGVLDDLRNSEDAETPAPASTLDLIRRLRPELR